MQWPQISSKFKSCYKDVQSRSATCIINLLPFAFSGAGAGWKLERWAPETSVSFHCLHLLEMSYHLVFFHLVEWNPAHQRPLWNYTDVRSTQAKMQAEIPESREVSLNWVSPKLVPVSVPTSKAEILLLCALFCSVVCCILVWKAGNVTSAMGALTKFYNYIEAKKIRCQHWSQNVITGGRFTDVLSSFTILTWNFDSFVS